MPRERWWRQVGRLSRIIRLPITEHTVLNKLGTIESSKKVAQTCRWLADIRYSIFFEIPPHCFRTRRGNQQGHAPGGGHRGRYEDDSCIGCDWVRFSNGGVYQRFEHHYLQTCAPDLIVGSRESRDHCQVIHGNPPAPYLPEFLKHTVNSASSKYRWNGGVRIEHVRRLGCRGGQEGTATTRTTSPTGKWL